MFYNKKIRELERKIAELRLALETERRNMEIWKHTIYDQLRTNKNGVDYVYHKIKELRETVNNKTN